MPPIQRRHPTFRSARRSAARSAARSASRSPSAHKASGGGKISVTITRNGYVEKPWVVEVRRGAIVADLVRTFMRERLQTTSVDTSKMILWDPNNLKASIKTVRKDTSSGDALVVGTKDAYEKLKKAAAAKKK